MEKWFKETLDKVMVHNDYKEDMITTDVCDKEGKWTPCDLILREYFNNGCGSAKGFLGISSDKCEKSANYILDNKEELVENHYLNKEGWNNCGFPLWKFE